MKKLFIIILICLNIFACTKRSDKLIVGLIKPSLNHFPFEFGIREGLIAEDEYDIKYFSAGWEVNEALVSGKIDLSIMPFTYTWTDVAKGKKVKIISFLERESDGIICKSNIQNIKELKSKKIGVLRASTLDVFAEMFSEKYNLNLELVYFRSPMEMAAALQSNAVDALSFYVPPIFKFSDDFRIIHWFGEDFPSHTCCDISATEYAIRNKREQIEKFISEMNLSVTLLNKNKEKAITIAMKIFGFPEEIIEKSLRFTEYKINLSEQDKRFERKVMEKMLKLGYVDVVPNPAEVYDEIK
ncbi:MAG: transporter substrate-binding domain-containing protein [Candidatus Cloacimonadota bacterium]|nr:transporter substrate-binding domain-containing protein [Candidatus Cloacimonadota bacterium]